MTKSAFLAVVLSGTVALAQPPSDQAGPPKDRAVVARFDQDGNGRLDTSERTAARAALAQETGPRSGGRPPLGGGRPGVRPGGDESAQTFAAGAKITPAEVTAETSADLFDPSVVRTLFIDFESADWFDELQAFDHTDVEVPATVRVDGEVYRDVGVHIRGNSSDMMVPAGGKRSLNLSFDFVHESQRLLGHRTLNLLNSHEDPSFQRTVLASQIANAYLPTPRAAFARVVINGENWGLYVTVEQFNKDFAKTHFGTAKGARWKVPGSPGARGGLEYLGEEVSAYQAHYEIKSKDTPEAWAALIKVCRRLAETPDDQLVAALSPVLDIEGALRFLALDAVLANGDGYWTRASDYGIAFDDEGRVRLVFLDLNETFTAGGPPMGGGGFPGPGRDQRPPFVDVNSEVGDLPVMRSASDLPRTPRAVFGGGGPGAGGATLDPLVGLDNTRTPLRSRLLKIPALRARYLELVREIARSSLDWEVIGAIATANQERIAPFVQADTRKLSSTEAFKASLAPAAAPTPAAAGSETEPVRRGRPGPREATSLRAFIEQRRAYLLAYPASKDIKPSSSSEAPAGTR